MIGPSIVEFHNMDLNFHNCNILYCFLETYITFQVIDDTLMDFLNSSYNEGLLNRSAVVILGDHGNRIDTIRSTLQGKIEDSMPMVSIILPKWVNASWRRALELNSNRLTSTYDLYATFVDILDTLGGVPGEPGHSNKRIWDHFSQPSRGQSLFKEIPLTRDCEEAGIPAWYCICNEDEEKLSPDHPIALRSANTVISDINHLLKNYSSCAKLYLNGINQAVKKIKKDIIHVTFSAKPSNALFEATVNISNKTYRVVNIQRINPYGSQASCLGKDILSKNTLYKATCYC